MLYLYVHDIRVLTGDSDIHVTILEHMFEEYHYEGSNEFASANF